MRTFLAIEIPDEAKREIEDQLSAFKKEYEVFNWIPPHSYHLTLHFFGEIPSVDSVRDGIETAIYDIRPFHVFGLSAGIFVSQKILMYLEMRREKTLEVLVDRFNAAFPDTVQKKFVPHLSIARYKLPSKQQYFLIKKKLEHINIDLEFAVDKISLFESHPSARAAVYKKLAEFPLLQEK